MSNFNQSDLAHQAVISGMFAENVAAGVDEIIASKMFWDFNNRLPQAAPGNMNVMGRLFHKWADTVAPIFGYEKVCIKHPSGRVSKKKYRKINKGA